MMPSIGEAQRRYRYGYLDMYTYSHRRAYVNTVDDDDVCGERVMRMLLLPW